MSKIYETTWSWILFKATNILIKFFWVFKQEVCRIKKVALLGVSTLFGYTILHYSSAMSCKDLLPQRGNMGDQ